MASRKKRTESRPAHRHFHHQGGAQQRAYGKPEERDQGIERGRQEMAIQAAALRNALRPRAEGEGRIHRLDQAGPDVADQHQRQSEYKYGHRQKQMLAAHRKPACARRHCQQGQRHQKIRHCEQDGDCQARHAVRP